MKEIFVSQFQLDQSLEIRCQSYIHTKNEKTNKEFIVWQSAALSTTNILLLVTHILSESNDSTLFIIINISIITIIMIIMKRKFYFILDEFGCHIYFNTFQLIVLCYFLQQLIWLNWFFQLFFHAFFHFVFIKYLFFHNHNCQGFLLQSPCFHSVQGLFFRHTPKWIQ